MVCRVNIFGGVERQRSGGVHHDIDALHRTIDHTFVANITLDLSDLVAFRIGEVGDVERDNAMAARQEITR